MGNGSLKRIIAAISLCVLFTSCNQSLFQVLTHNDVGYWSQYWMPKDPRGSIIEYSKKDSSMKYLDENWFYDDHTPALWGLKFRITMDSLFEYVDRKGYVKTYDTLSIASYTKNRIVLKNGAKWHRISTRYARKMINAPTDVKLSSLMRKHDRNKSITDIVGVVWKLYGYGDVTTGIVHKSETLRYDWSCVVKFWESGSISGQTTYEKIYGKYTISGQYIDIMELNGGEKRKSLDVTSFVRFYRNARDLK